MTVTVTVCVLQNEDGGWGLHIESPSTMFGSALNYVALRLLGEDADGGEGRAMTKARAWILGHGGATAITSWGKLWLSVLGVYEWSGNNPLPPEFWLLPYFLPFHPGTFTALFSSINTNPHPITSSSINAFLTTIKL